MSASPLFADLSSNNAYFHAAQYREAGHLVVAVKATEGVSYVNPEHRPWSYQAGMERVAIIHYHFARPDQGNTADAEARFFLEVALPLAGGRDFLALDLERATPQGWSHDPAWSYAFDRYVQAHSRFHTILYASRSTLELNDRAWLDYQPGRVWDADWSDAPDYAPPGMITVIRQQSGVVAGRPPFELPGVGPCDVDVARGGFWSHIIDKSR